MSRLRKSQDGSLPPFSLLWAAQVTLKHKQASQPAGALAHQDTDVGEAPCVALSSALNRGRVSSALEG